MADELDFQLIIVGREVLFRVKKRRTRLVQRLINFLDFFFFYFNFNQTDRTEEKSFEKSVWKKKERKFLNLRIFHFLSVESHVNKNATSVDQKKKQKLAILKTVFGSSNVKFLCRNYDKSWKILAKLQVDCNLSINSGFLWQLKTVCLGIHQSRFRILRHFWNLLSSKNETFPSNFIKKNKNNFKSKIVFIDIRGMSSGVVPPFLVTHF